MTRLTVSRARPSAPRLLMLILCCVWLVGCASDSPERLWLNAPEWSRAVLVGKSAVADPVPVAIADDGNVYVLMLESQGETAVPRVVILDRQANVVGDVRLSDNVLTRPDQPELVWHDDRLHLFWVNSQTLFTAEMAPDGSLMSEPEAISAEVIVDRYDVAVRPDGGLDVWMGGTRQDPGLYALQLGDSAESATLQLIDERGQRPSLRYDASGTLHALWLDYPTGFEQTRFLYASYPDGNPTPDSGQVLVEPSLSPSMVLEGPWLGLDTTTAYVFWSRVIRTGPEAGSMATQYVMFPPDDPDMTVEVSLAGLDSAELPYQPYPDAIFKAGERVDQATAGVGRSGDVLDVSPVQTSVGELAIAYSVPAQHQYRKVARQIATTFLSDGELNGYQLLSFSRPASEAPMLTNDDALSLYITWLERAEGGGFQIYFASTAPDLYDALSGLTSADMAYITRETVFGMLSGMALAPFVIFLWGAGGLIVFGLTSFMRRNENPIGTIISLGLSVVAYSAVKLLSLPGMRTYVPFSAWIPRIPDWMQAPLQIVTPLVITLFALWLAWYVIYRRGSKSALYFFFLFVAVDGFLTMAIYGFLIYNTI